VYQAAPGILDPEHLVNTFGLIGLLVIIFAECGLLLGFFLPGDSLLFAAGLLIASGVFDVPLWAVLVGVPIAASLGSLVGYWIGRKAGPALFDKPDGRIFKKKYVDQAHEFFETRGPFAIIAGRFVPVVRTFITVIAGVSRMDFRRYATYSIGVSAVWGVGFPLAGYYLGRIQFVKDNVEVIALIIAVVSILPVVVEFLKHRRKNKAARGESDPAAVEPPAA
jgi:membrane-associated protein